MSVEAQKLPRRQPLTAPQPGDTIVGARTGRAITLDSQIGIGGNAQVFRTSDGRAVKFFDLPQAYFGKRDFGSASPHREAAMQAMLPRSAVTTVDDIDFYFSGRWSTVLWVRFFTRSI